MLFLGDLLGFSNGVSFGDLLGVSVGVSVGVSTGVSVGVSTGVSVGVSVGILNNSSLENDYTLIELLPKKDDNNMKKDLKNFLKKLQKPNNNNNMDINIDTLNTLDILNNDKNLYSNY